MSISGLNLLIPEKTDPERDRVADAWIAQGGQVTRIGRFWEPPELDRTKVRFYGNDTFVLVLAQKLGLSLVSPPDDLLLRLPAEALLREVRAIPLSQATGLSFPTFIKPLVPKQFAARVYSSADALMAECAGLDSSTQIYVSEVVQFTSEARAFVLDGVVRDIALYEGADDVGGALRAASYVAVSGVLPASCVLDMGYIRERGWAVVEANAAWGAGLNGCSPEKVIDCIACATTVERGIGV